LTSFHDQHYGIYVKILFPEPALNFEFSFQILFTCIMSDQNLNIVASGQGCQET
jgi:hypothetical protein